ncbi:MAG: preprotein translocase subunit SecE [Patescibacteria group bacterium]
MNIEKIKSFLQESKKEFRRVNWPTYQETVRLTIIVVAMSLLVAAFLGLFDFIFLIGLESLL